MRMPEVSVVMPVYNGEKYIRQAIEFCLHSGCIPGIVGNR